MRFVMAFLVSLTASNAFSSPGGIYGQDDRKDYFEIVDPRIKEIAKSTATIISKDELLELPNGNFKKINKTTLTQAGMCPSEKFASQPTFGHCSGSLIERDVFLTAAHCFTIGKINSTHFKSMYVVFDYLLESSTQVEIEIKRENVFQIAEVLYYDLFYNSSSVDLSTVRLDRIVDREPLKVNRSFNYAVGTQLFMIGYPMGLPLKYTDNATISKLNVKDHSFHNDLDAFSANSGSAIFDYQTKEIIGVLARGPSLNYKLNEGMCSDWGVGEIGQSEEGMLLWDLPNL